MLSLRIIIDEEPPPGVGLKTVIIKVPDVSISDAFIIAVSWPLFINVVDLFKSLNLTIDDELKLEPVTEITNPGSPTVIHAGEIVEIIGTGL